jgi:HEAT repeat protein
VGKRTSGTLFYRQKAMKKLEQQLAALDALRNQPVTPATTVALRKAIGDRNNYLSGKAASAAAALGIREVVPDLLTAFERFLRDPVKTDPQCWGKNGILQALADLGHDEPEPFLRGLRHVQMEPVWGGQTDTAGPLRARSAQALIGCRSITDAQLLAYLLEALVDADKTVRAEAARAIGRIDRHEAALLLRLRALTGDDEPEVVGACLSGVLSIEGDQGIDFVVRFLDREDDTASEAALSLGMTRSPRAFEILRQRWEQSHNAILLTAMALTRLPEAFALLTSIAASGRVGESDAARRAIELVHPPSEVISELEKAATSRS